jgi:hypothetical protein
MYGPETILDQTTKLAAGISVQVNLHGTSTAAQLYQPTITNGIQVLPVTLSSSNYGTNPVSTDSLGNLIFWAAPGVYDLLFSIQGVQTTRTVVVRADPAESGLITPVFRAAQNSAQSISSGTDSIIVLLQDVLEDSPSAYNTTTGTWTCQVSGLYQIYGQVAIATGSANTSLFFSRITTSTTLSRAESSRLLLAGMQAGLGFMPVSLIERFTAGQTAELAVYQGTGSPQNTSGDYQTFLSIVKVSD